MKDTENDMNFYFFRFNDYKQRFSFDVADQVRIGSCHDQIEFKRMSEIIQNDTNPTFLSQLIQSAFFSLIAAESSHTRLNVCFDV